MTKRTTLYLDEAALEEARRALGTKGTTETVHRALREVARLESLRWLAAHDFPDLTPESVRRIREDGESWPGDPAS